MTPPVPPVPPINQPDSTQTLTPPPPQTPTEFDVVKQQLATLAGAVQNLTQHIQNNNRPPEPAPLPPISAEEFQNNPQVMLDRIMAEQQRQIAPLLEFRQQFNRANAYTQVKNQVKASHPNLTRLWGQIEPQLDQIFSTGQVEPNAQLVYYNAMAILGGLSLQAPTSNGNLTPAPIPPNMIPPSGSPPPGTPPIPTRALDANEQLLARQKGLTDAQYLQLTEGSVMLVTPAAERGKK